MLKPFIFAAITATAVSCFAGRRSINTAWADPPALKVEAGFAGGLASREVHPKEQLDVELRVVNTSATRQSFRIMNCAWTASWRSDDRDVSLPGVDCSKNFQITVDLAPGAADVRTLELVVMSGATATHRFRLGFQPIGATTVIWSQPITVNVIAVATALGVTGAYVAPRGVTFRIANAGKQPIGIADQLEIQHNVGNEWTDLTWMSASLCNEMTPLPYGGQKGGTTTAPRCLKIGAGAHLDYSWDGMTCAQCVCSASVPAEAGNYRLIARECDGSHDYISNTVSPALPPTDLPGHDVGFEEAVKDSSGVIIARLDDLGTAEPGPPDGAIYSGSKWTVGEVLRGKFAARVALDLVVQTYGVTDKGARVKEQIPKVGSSYILLLGKDPTQIAKLVDDTRDNRLRIKALTSHK